MKKAMVAGLVGLAILASGARAAVTFAASANNAILDAGSNPITTGTAVFIADLDGDGLNGTDYTTSDANASATDYLWDSDDAVIAILDDWSAWGTFVPGPDVTLFTFQAPGVDVDSEPDYTQDVDAWYLLTFDNGGNAAEPGENVAYAAYLALSAVPPPGGTATMSFDPVALNLMTPLANPPLVWDGDDASIFWNTGGNWVGDAAPTGGELLEFAGSNTNNSNNLAAGTSFAGINFQSGASAFVLNGNAIVIESGGAITNNSTNAQELNLDVASASPMTFDAAAGNLVFSQQVSITSDTLTVTGDFNVTFDGTLVGAGNVDKTGTGTFIVDSDNTGFDGDLMLTEGTMQIDPNAVFDGDNSFTFAGGTLANNTGGDLALNNATTISGDFAIDPGGQLVDIQGDVDLGGGTRQIQSLDNAAGAVVQLSGVVSNGGLSLTGSTGDEVFSLTGANTYADGTALDTVVVQVGDDAALGGGAVAVDGGSTIYATGQAVALNNVFNLNSGLTLGEDPGTAQDLTLSNQVNVNQNVTLSVTNTAASEVSGDVAIGANTLTVDAQQDLAISGEMTGSGTINKTGAGDLELIGNSAFTGLLDIDEGTVDLEGSTDGSATVDSATLEGTGTLGDGDDTLTVNNGGIIAPGASVGTLSIGGDVDFNAGSTLAVEIDTSLGTPADLLAVTGVATFDDAFGITVDQLGGPDITNGQTFDIVDAGNPLTINLASINVVSNISGVDFDLQLDAGDDSILQLLASISLVWDGSTDADGDDTNFSDVNNWQNDAFPGNDLAGTSISFAADADGSATADGGTAYTNIGGLTANDGLGAFTLTGADLDFVADADIVNNDPNLLTIDNNIVAGGALLVNANAGNIDLNGNIDLGAGGDLTVTGDNDTSLDGVISGSGGLVKNGAGQLTVTGDNAFNGNTTLNSGTLALGHNNALGNGSLTLEAGTTLLATGGPITIDNTVNVNGDFTIGGAEALDIAGVTTLNFGDLGGATRTVTIDNTATTTWSGTVAASNGTLAKAGDGLLVISGDNSASLMTDFEVNAGALTVQNGHALSDSGSVTVASGATFNVNDPEIIDSFNAVAGSTVNVDGTLTIGANGGDSTVAANVAGTAGLTQDGAGTATLSGDNTYAGDTTVNAGTLDLTGTIDGGLVVSGGTAIIGRDDAVAAGQTITLDSGAIQAGGGDRTLGNDVSVNGDFAVADTNSLELTGGVDFGDLAAGTRTVTVSNPTTTLSGTLSGSNGTLAKAGTGNLVVTGDNNAMTAGFQLDAGTLGIGNDNALGSTQFVINGGTIEAVGGDRTVSVPVDVNADFTLGGSNNMTFAAAPIDFGDLGGATRTLTVSDTLVLRFGDTVDAANGTLAKAGTGELWLTADNAITSIDADVTLALNEGVLGLCNDNPLGAGTLAISGGTTLKAVSCSAVTINNTVNVAGDFTIGGSQDLEIAGVTSLNFGDLGGATRTVTIDNTATTEWSAVANASNGTLAKAGDGDLIISGNNAGTLLTDLQVDAGTLIFQGGNALDDNQSVSVASGATFQVDDAETIDALTAPDTSAVTLNDTLSLGANAGDSTIDIAVAGTGSTVLLGGTLELGAAGSLPDTLTVQGGILSGNGAISSDLVLAGGTVSPGTSIGILSTGGNLDLQAAATFAVELDSDNPGTGKADPGDADYIDVTGTADVASGLTFQIGNVGTADFEVGQFYKIIQTGGGVTAAGVTGDPETDRDNFFGMELGDVLFGPVLSDDTNDFLLEVLEVTNLEDKLEELAGAGDLGAALEGLEGADPDLVDALKDLSDEQLQQLAEQIAASGQGSTSVTPQVLINVVQAFLSNQSTYLAAKRQGGSQYMQYLAFAGPARPMGGPTLASDAIDPGLMSNMLADASLGSQIYQDAARGSYKVDTRFGVYGKVYGIFSDIGATDDRFGYDADAYGVQAGFDYQIDPQWLVGIAFGYTRTEADLDNGAGSTDIDTFRVGPYFSYYPEPWYVEGSLTYGFNSIETTSNTIAGTNEGEADAHDVTAYLGVGYNYEVNPDFIITPMASLQFMHFDREGYDESGGGLARSFPDEQIQSLHSRLGVRFAYTIRSDSVTFVPDMVVGWEHEYLQDDDTTDVEFAGGGGQSFAIKTAAPDQDSAFVGVGLSALFDDDVSAYVRYDGTFSGDSDIHGVEGGVRIRF